MFYPHHDRVSQDYPHLPVEERTRWLCQCSARAAQNIEGHHRPVIASNFHQLNADSPSKKTAASQSRLVYLAG